MVYLRNTSQISSKCRCGLYKKSFELNFGFYQLNINDTFWFELSLLVFSENLSCSNLLILRIYRFLHEAFSKLWIFNEIQTQTLSE